MPRVTIRERSHAFQDRSPRLHQADSRDGPVGPFLFPTLSVAEASDGLAPEPYSRVFTPLLKLLHQDLSDLEATVWRDIKGGVYHWILLG